MVDIIMALKSKYPKTIRVFDPLESICPSSQSKCNIYSNGSGFLFYDFAHLNVEIAKSLADPFMKSLREKR